MPQQSSFQEDSGKNIPHVDPVLLIICSTNIKKVQIQTQRMNY
jgi:hypothetical protein